MDGEINNETIKKWPYKICDFITFIIWMFHEILFLMNSVFLVLSISYYLREVSVEQAWKEWNFS